MAGEVRPAATMRSSGERFLGVICQALPCLSLSEFGFDYNQSPQLVPSSHLEVLPGHESLDPHEEGRVSFLPGEAGGSPRGKITCPRSHSQSTDRAATQPRPPNPWSYTPTVAGVKMQSFRAGRGEFS